MLSRSTSCGQSAKKNYTQMSRQSIDNGASSPLTMELVDETLVLKINLTH
jgi:hypothetical protein